MKSQSIFGEATCSFLGIYESRGIKPQIVGSPYTPQEGTPNIGTPLWLPRCVTKGHWLRQSIPVMRSPSQAATQNC